jgi:hypothetical protein
MRRALPRYPAGRGDIFARIQVSSGGDLPSGMAADGFLHFISRSVMTLKDIDFILLYISRSGINQETVVALPDSNRLIAPRKAMPYREDRHSGHRWHAVCLGCV